MPMINFKFEIGQLVQTTEYENPTPRKIVDRRYEERASRSFIIYGHEANPRGGDWQETIEANLESTTS